MIARRTLVFAAATTLLGAAGALAADQPGQKFSISVNALPGPYATPGGDNHSITMPRPSGALPAVPPGFKVAVYAAGLSNPRWMAVAPNGDVFLAEPSAGQITVLHEANGGKVQTSVFAAGFRTPHGLALTHDALYVGDLMGVWRVPYKPGDTKAGPRSKVTSAPDLSPVGNHVTRDLAIDSKGTIYVAIGSASNVGEDPPTRATVQTVGPDGALKPYATGLRNPVGIAFYPGTDDLFVTVNERDGFGDELVPGLSDPCPAGCVLWLALCLARPASRSRLGQQAA
ncbi:MAG: hypothetical protein WDN03_04060 [Rhizomicrobium sp.]